MAKPRTFTVLNTVSQRLYHTTASTRSQLAKRLERHLEVVEPSIRISHEGCRQLAARLWDGGLVYLPELAWVLVEGLREAHPVVPRSGASISRSVAA